MALCSRAVQGVRAVLPACAARQYSTAVASLDEALSGVTSGLPLPSGLEAKPSAQVSTLKNGLKVASFETYAPVSTIGLVVGAGSANEASHEVGASAMLRALAFKSNGASTQFAVARSTEEIGGRLHSVNSRDHVILYASATRDNAGHLVEVLGNEFTKKKVLPWEVQQARDEIAYQAHAITHDPAFQAIDALHGAAFRGPLGNSVNPGKHRLNALSADTLHAFAASKYVAGNAALVGYGIQHDELVRLAEAGFSGAQGGDAAARAKSTYSGASEHRVDNGSYVSHVALGFEGAVSNSSDALAIGVLQHALGVSPSVMWGTSSSIFGQKLASVIKAPATLSAFSASYADAGLFGVLAVSSSNDIGCVLGAARDALKEVASKGLSKDDVTRGKAQLKLSILTGAEGAYAGIERLGAEVLSSGKVSNIADVIKAIDGLSDAAINQAAKKVLSSKPSLAAVGDLTQIPHLDQLA